jgi:lipopolysaccharide/colanic/teichoic acid biosynthesis glycosyltransferase
MHFSHSKSDVVERSFSADIKPHIIAGNSGVYRNTTKYFVDAALTLLAAPLVVPLVVFLAVMVMLGGHAPFYSQMRIGKNGRVFRMWKLRTMVHDADTTLESYLKSNPNARLEWEETQKLKEDPRITRIGRIMRKTSMDELPQLWNVLNGTMSLVGPRPMMLKQRGLYHGKGYFNLKPGITGLWQISDRNHCDFADRAHFDDVYDRIVSLKTDMSVLLRTVGVVLRGTGY